MAVQLFSGNNLICEQKSDTPLGDSKQCSHGFNVAGTKIDKSAFDFFETICDHEFTIIHKARCKSDGKCQLAIKQYKFINEDVRNSFDKEVTAFNILRKNPHKNFITFFGSFFDDANGYIVLELGIDRLSNYVLPENKHSLSVTQINNITYQMLSMAKHMFDIGFILNDHNKYNIVLCSDSTIKAIDFESYQVHQTGTDDCFSKRILINAASYFIQFQLELKCRTEGTCYEESLKYFYDKYWDGFPSDTVPHFIVDDKLWHKDISSMQKDFIAQCLVCDKQRNLIFYHKFSEQLDVFSPRDSLVEVKLLKKKEIEENTPIRLTNRRSTRKTNSIDRYKPY